MIEILQKNGAAQIKGFLNRKALQVSATCVKTLLISAILAAILMSCNYGRDRGHQKIIPVGGTGHFFYGVCSVLSNQKYDLGRYACDDLALQEMREAGLYYSDHVLQPLGKTLKEVLKDTTYLNNGLEKIFSGAHRQGRNIGMALGWGGDAGYADYIELSFSLFGYNVGALYYTFYLLIFMSSFLFILQFYDNITPLLVLAVFHYVISALITTGFLSHTGLETITNPRFVTTLALTPLFHALYAIIYRIRITALSILMLFLQAALMTFALGARSSTIWMFVALIGFSVLLILLSGLFNRKWLASLRRCWPTMIVLATLVGGNYLADLKADPRLEADGWMRKHNFWFTAYYNIQYHPDWKTKYRDKHGGTSGDGPAMFALNKYIKQNNLDFKNNKEAYRKDGGLKHIYMEKYSRAVLLHFLVDDPKYIYEAYLINNAVSIYNFIRDSVRRIIPTMGWKIWGVLFAAISVLVLEIQRCREKLSDVVVGGAAILLLPAVAVLPNYLSVIIGDSMGDPVIMVGTAIISGAIMAFVVLGVLCIRPLSSLIAAIVSLKHSRRIIN
jgi:hypothetical protein